MSGNVAQRCVRTVNVDVSTGRWCFPLHNIKGYYLKKKQLRELSRQMTKYNNKKLSISRKFEKQTIQAALIAKESFDTRE